MSAAEPVLSDITEHWGVIKPHLEALCDSNSSFGLRPEHVYDACTAEQADLWVAPEGFVVTRFITDDDTGTRTLFLWVACATTGKNDLSCKYLPFFEEVAKYTNCKYIELWSSRGGMERYLTRQEFKLFYRSFRKEV